MERITEEEIKLWSEGVAPDMAKYDYDELITSMAKRIIELKEEVFDLVCEIREMGEYQ